jgi:serine protease Do
VALSGIQLCDVSLGFNGGPIKTMHELPRFVANTAPRADVDVRVLRKGQEQTIQVKVGQMPEEQGQAALEVGRQRNA